jgi:hypothetical protein
LLRAVGAFGALVRDGSLDRLALCTQPAARHVAEIGKVDPRTKGVSGTRQHNRSDGTIFRDGSRGGAQSFEHVSVQSVLFFWAVQQDVGHSPIDLDPNAIRQIYSPKALLW